MIGRQCPGGQPQDKPGQARPTEKDSSIHHQFLSQATPEQLGSSCRVLSAVMFYHSHLKSTNQPADGFFQRNEIFSAARAEAALLMLKEPPVAIVDRVADNARMVTQPNELIPTRESLLSRLKNWEDRDSWEDFFDTYWKLIYGTARKAGLTDAEAQDIVHIWFKVEKVDKRTCRLLDLGAIVQTWL
jgi:hypothetical protein